MMEQYIKALTELTMSEQPNFGNADSVLSLLYEAYNDLNSMDTAQIKTAFKALYETMNNKTLEEMDTILYPVCTLSREHELSGFITGIKLGLHLSQELKKNIIPIANGLPRSSSKVAPLLHRYILLDFILS